MNFHRLLCEFYPYREGPQVMFVGLCSPIYTWFVVSNIFISHNIWDNPSHWLIFFIGIEPPTRYAMIDFRSKPDRYWSYQLKPFSRNLHRLGLSHHKMSKFDSYVPWSKLGLHMIVNKGGWSSIHINPLIDISREFIWPQTIYHTTSVLFLNI